MRLYSIHAKQQNGNLTQTLDDCIALPFNTHVGLASQCKI